ncbi:Sigma-54-dependent Fis family transcriptional regulator [Desulfovibrionales bacterium]
MYQAATLATILVVDDDSNILQVLVARLSSAGHNVLTASSAEEGLERLAVEVVDLIISDVKMPGMGGRAFLEEVLAFRPYIPVVLLTAFGAIPDAVMAIQAGAADYLTKPFNGQELLDKVQSILSRRPSSGAFFSLIPATKFVAVPGQSSIVKTDRCLNFSVQKRIGRDLCGGRSPAMRKVYDIIERIAPADVNVLVLGESGTGKECVAKILHDLSSRAKGPFVVVDCGSTPATLLESELFGHVKGSFTHAMRDKKGLIEEADRGTLFLDEIGNISPEMQTRLLRFLQEHTIRRIGDTKVIPVTCRVIAATHADLPALVREGTFREDLYFRLKVVTLHLPPLRERKEDIPLLAEYFVAGACREQHRSLVTLTSETMADMLIYSWPGNVRELKNALEAGVALCQDDTLRPDDLQLETLAHGGIGPLRRASSAGVLSPLPSSSSLSWKLEAGEALSLDESEHRAIIKALECSGWVQTAAADILGISRRAIHYKIKKHGIKILNRSRQG